MVGRSEIVPWPGSSRVRGQNRGAEPQNVSPDRISSRARHPIPSVARGHGALSEKSKISTQIKWIKGTDFTESGSATPGRIERRRKLGRG